MSGRVSLGAVLARLSAALRAHWIGYLLATLTLVAVPIVLILPLGELLDRLALPPEAVLLVRFVGLTLIVSLPVGAVVHLTAAPREGRRRAIGEALIAAIVNQPVVLAIGVAAGAVRPLADFLGLMASRSEPEQAGNLVLVQIVCWILTAVSAAATFMAAPAAVCEKIGPLAAIRRGWRLAAGRRGLELGLFLLAWLPFAFAFMLVAATIAFLPAGSHTQDAATLGLLAAGLLLAFCRTLTVALATTSYLEFRRVVDPPLEETASVFA